MKTQGWQVAVAIGLGLSGAIAASPTTTSAQVVADPSIGTIVTPNGTTLQITGGATIGNRNLFHSFSQFDVPIDSVASFLNSPNIVNIFSRVTGGTRSQIDGIIRAGGTANLFLMNPSGIVFGQTARLDVGGSFVATTANAIQFGDRGFFSASLSEPPSQLLTVDPSAFLFNQINIAPIQSNSRNLYVRDGQSLLLLGGDVTLDNGFLGVATDIGGRAELGGLAAPGKVDLAIDGGLFHLSFPNDVLRGDVTLKNGSQVNVIAGNSGSIAVHARNLSILSSSSLVAGIGSGLGTPDSQAGDIVLNVTGVTEANQSSSIRNDVNPNATGSSGNIYVTTGSLFLDNNAVIRTSTFGKGKAGNINVQASDQVTLNNVAVIASNVQSIDAIGDGGNVSLKASSILIQGGAQVNAFARGQGNAGNVTIRADSVEIKGTSSDGQYLSGISSDVNSGATGNGGNLTINTQHLAVRDGAHLSASTYGNGNAGNITIAGSTTSEADSVELRGVSSNGYVAGLFVDVGDSVTGTAVHGGDLTIATQRLNINDGARISASTFGAGDAGNVTIHASDKVEVIGTKINGNNSFVSQIVTDVGRDAKGNGGNLTIETPQLIVRDGAQISSSTFGQGNAGNITIHSDSIELSGESSNGQYPGGLLAQVEANSNGRNAIGNGGNLSIYTRRLSISDGSKIQVATAGEGNAGNLFIQADAIDIFETSRPNFFSTVINAGVTWFQRNNKPVGAQPVGNGGNLTIETGRLTIKGGEVAADNQGRGRAGKVLIHARDLVEVVGVSVDPNPEKNNSLLSARVLKGATGPGGDLTISTRQLSVRDGGQISVGTAGAGDAGTLRIYVDGSTEIIGISPDGKIQSQVSAAVETNSTGFGGSVNLETGQLSIRDGGLITSRSRGQQAAGNININVRETLQANNGDISTNSVQAGGGNINIAARNIFLRGNSDITTDSGTSNGGNITLTANSIIALNDSDILAFAQQGKGGNITLNTRAFFGQNYRPGSPAPWDGNDRVDINASGTVAGIITLPDVSFLQNSLTEFPQTFTDTTQLLANSCIVRSRKQNGKFFITGSGGLPVRPGDAPLSPFPTGEVRSVRGERDEGRGMRDEGREETYVIQNSAPGTQDLPDRPWKIGDPIVEPQGVYRLANGELVMSRECK